MSEGLGRRGRKILEKLGMSFVHRLGHLLTYATNTHDVGVLLGLNSLITSQTIKRAFLYWEAQYAAFNCEHLSMHTAITA
jgi:hypothetical protein